MFTVDYIERVWGLFLNNLLELELERFNYGQLIHGQSFIEPEYTSSVLRMRYVDCNHRC